MREGSACRRRRGAERAAARRRPKRPPVFADPRSLSSPDAPLELSPLTPFPWSEGPSGAVWGVLLPGCPAGQGGRSSGASWGQASAEGQGRGVGWGAGSLLVREGLGGAEKGVKERERDWGGVSEGARERGRGAPCRDHPRVPELGGRSLDWTLVPRAPSVSPVPLAGSECRSPPLLGLVSMRIPRFRGCRPHALVRGLSLQTSDSGSRRGRGRRAGEALTQSLRLTSGVATPGGTCISGGRKTRYLQGQEAGAASALVSYSPPRSPSETGLEKHPRAQPGWGVQGVLRGPPPPEEMGLGRLGCKRGVLSPSRRAPFSFFFFIYF